MEFPRQEYWSGLLFPFPIIYIYAAAAAKSLQSCLTLCDPTDGTPPGSPVLGILQARTLEWVAISFSNAWKWKVKVKSLSCVWLLATPWTGAYQAPLSMGFARQDYWSGLPYVYKFIYICLSKNRSKYTHCVLTLLTDLVTLLFSNCRVFHQMEFYSLFSQTLIIRHFGGFSTKYMNALTLSIIIWWYQTSYCWMTFQKCYKICINL